MKIEFYFEGEFLPGTEAERHEEREVLETPRKGDIIAWHKTQRSTRYEVLDVIRVYEDRPHYQNKSYGGDRVCVRLRTLGRI